MGSYKTIGIILRRTDYGEADRIYTILTPERKVSAIAKGVRKSTAKLAAHLDLFAEIELMLIEGKTLDVITSARRINGVELSTDYERLRRGFLFLEMADKLTDTENVLGVYRLMVEALGWLERGSIELVELSFKLKLLDELGHAPDMSNPRREQNGLGLDIEQGSLSTQARPLVLGLDQNGIKLWRLLLERSYDEVCSIGGVEEAAVQSLAVCDRFIAQQFGIRFKAAEM